MKYIIKNQKDWDESPQGIICDEFQIDSMKHIIIQDIKPGIITIIKDSEALFLKAKRNDTIFKHNSIRVHGNAYVVSETKNIIYAYNDSRVLAMNDTYVVAFNQAKISLLDSSECYANDKVKVSAYGKSIVRTSGAEDTEVVVAVYDARVTIVGHNNTKVIRWM